MLAKKLLATGRVASGIALGSLLLVSGCATPTLNVVPALPAAPTVAQVQDHVICVLARTLNKHVGPGADPNTADFKLWRRLIDENFLGTINLTLFVTQSENLNPTLNSITPLTNLGHAITVVTDSSNGVTNPTNPTSNTSNLTVDVGLQATGTQDHNFLLNYVVDVHRLYDMMYQSDAGPPVPQPNGLLAACAAHDRAGANGVPYGLKGDLAIEDMLETGLTALDTAVYSPVTAGAVVNKANQTASSASVSQTAGTTGFSSKYDFSLLWGVDGGPSWTLLKFKGPGGGTAANGQLVSYSRQKQDSLIATFGPTCTSDTMIDFNSGGAQYFPAFPKYFSGDKFTSFEFIAFRRAPITTEQLKALPEELQTLISRHQLTSEIISALPKELKEVVADASILITVAIPQDTSGLPYTYTGAAAGTISINDFRPGVPDVPEANGTISWSAFGVAASPKTTPYGSYSLRGMIADAQSGSLVGYLTVGLATPDKDGRTHILSMSVSANTIRALLHETDPGPATYWQSLPACSIAAPFLPSGLNVLQQLPGGVSTALVQQR